MWGPILSLTTDWYFYTREAFSLCFFSFHKLQSSSIEVIIIKFQSYQWKLFLFYFNDLNVYSSYQKYVYVFCNLIVYSGSFRSRLSSFLTTWRVFSPKIWCYFVLLSLIMPYHSLWIVHLSPNHGASNIYVQNREYIEGQLFI